MKLGKRLKAIQPFLIAMILAVFMRAWAVSLLPQDFDEPIYLQNAFDYANVFRTEGLSGAIEYTGNIEHPPFVKLLYSAVLLILGEKASWTDGFFACRILSGIIGVLAVFMTALMTDPLAAGMLAIHTLAVKYSSQVYLEAVPHAITIASILFMVRAIKNNNHRDTDIQQRWFWASAVCLGIAAASKYSYLPVTLLVLAYLMVFEKKVKASQVLLYIGLAVLVFFVLDIHLWKNPLGRLWESLSFHIQYSQGEHVQEVGYPWYQPFIWLLTSSPGSWHPQVFFYYGFDGLITILALFGIKKEWKDRRWLVIWLASGIIFLLAWPTKWPQYALTVTPALCIMGAGTYKRFAQWIRAQEAYWNYIKEMIPSPGKWLWITIALFLLFIATIYLSAAIKLAVGRVGWSNITKANSFLPSNTIYDILPLEDDRVLIASDRGAAIWIAPETTDEEPTWILFTEDNSGLPDNKVLSLAVGMQGDLWFGTASGIGVFEGDEWSYHAASDIGLTSEYILSICSTPDGRIYAGTLEGASTWNGVIWTPIAETTGHPVFSINDQADGDVIWFGMDTGIGKYLATDGSWSSLLSDAPIKHILIDSQDNLWAATSGAGLARWDGSGWTYFKTSNSGIPYNTVNWVEEVEPGLYWLGTAHPTNAEGAAASFDGMNWNAFWYNNSGASAGEVTVVAVQSGQVWMGTRTAGIDLYRLGSRK